VSTAQPSGDDQGGLARGTSRPTCRLWPHQSWPPWLGTITLSDDAALDWCCNWRAAFRENPAALIDTITPILRRR